MMVCLTALACAGASMCFAPPTAPPASQSFIAVISSVAAVASQVVCALPGAVCASLTAAVGDVKANHFELASQTQYRQQLDAVWPGFGDTNIDTQKFKSGVGASMGTSVSEVSANFPHLHKSIDKILDQNPLLPAPSSIIELLNKTVPEASAQVIAFLAENWECCNPFPHKSKIKRLKADEMHIEFKEGYEDFVPLGKTYKTLVHLLPKLEAFLKELLDLGVIRPSTSPFCSPCLMIPKPHQEGVMACDLKYRMCVSLKDVNALTKTLNHRIPNIQSIWSTLGKAKYLSVVDLAHGFYQMSNCEEDGSINKTAFGTEFGHFEFVGCCMGAKNTPAHFQNRVEACLDRHNLCNVGLLRVSEDGKVSSRNVRACVSPYIDDLVIYSDTLEQHFEDLRRVFTCLSEEQYYIRPEKCAFCCKYVKSLGAIVGNGILACAPEKIESIYNWQKPVDMTSLRSFLGICNYLKNWYNDYSKVCQPLTNLLKKGVGVKAWDDNCTAAFNELKLGFMKYPILRLPDFDKPFVVVADACDISLGGALMQEFDTPDGTGKQLLPISYYSRLFNKHEVNYPVREKECLALHDVFKKHEYYLVGAKFTVALHTDHRSLLQLQKSGPVITNRRLLRWLEYFSGFDFNMKWIAGKSQLFGDGVSRSLRSVSGLEPLPPTHTSDLKMPKWTCGVVSNYDQRFDNIIYTDSKDFGEIWSVLDTKKAVNINAHPIIRYFEVRDERLYYKLSNGDRALCVPEGHFINSKGIQGKIPLREALVRECHDSPYMGHRGINKTYLAIRKLFYWPKLIKFVSKYVLSCKACARAKASTRTRISIKPNECPKMPFHSITMDFVTELPEVDGNTQILVVVDRFTKKLFTIPLHNTATALEVADLLYINIFREHGLPLQIISDRDTKFTSKIWKELFNIFGTTLTYGFAYHQRFDGQTEVMNRVIEEVLRCSINYTQTNWLILLPEATCAINNSVNTDSEFSANHIYYGRKLFMPIDLKFGTQHAHADIKAYLENMEVIRAIATESVRKAIIRYTTAHNTRAAHNIDPRFKIGAKVFLKAHNVIQPGHHQRKGKKLQDRQLGPFKITDTVGTTGFRLDMPGYQVHPEFSADSLVPFDSLESEFVVRALEPEADHYQGGEAFYEVDHLAARKTHYRKPYYFVMYKGFGVAEGDWVKEEILLQDCPDLVREYREKYLVLDKKGELHWVDPVGITRAKNNKPIKTDDIKPKKVSFLEPLKRSRGRPRGRGRPANRAGRGRGRGRGVNRPSMRGFGVPRVLSPKNTPEYFQGLYTPPPEPTLPLRRSRRVKKS